MNVQTGTDKIWNTYTAQTNTYTHTCTQMHALALLHCRQTYTHLNTHTHSWNDKTHNNGSNSLSWNDKKLISTIIGVRPHYNKLQSSLAFMFSIFEAITYVLKTCVQNLCSFTSLGVTPRRAMTLRTLPAGVKTDVALNCKDSTTAGYLSRWENAQNRENPSMLWVNAEISRRWHKERCGFHSVTLNPSLIILPAVLPFPIHTIFISYLSTCLCLLFLFSVNVVHLDGLKCLVNKTTRNLKTHIWSCEWTMSKYVDECAWVLQKAH